MNKRGQFYLFTAIILILVVFAISAQPNRLEEKVLLEDFNALSKNYANEAPKVVNDALKNDKNPVVNLGEYTNNFVEYAHTIDPNMGIVTVYASTKDPTGVNPQEFSVDNTGQEPITLDTTQGKKVLFSGQDKTNNDITLDVGGKGFQKNVDTQMKYFEGASSTPVSGLESITMGGVTYAAGSNFQAIITSKQDNNKKVSIIKQ